MWFKLNYSKKKAGPCQYNSSNIGSRLIGYGAATQAYDELTLQAAVALIGPISVTIDAAQFGPYSSGILDNPLCGTTCCDHAVVLVGYGTFGPGLDYWIVKNQWGEGWALDGYGYSIVDFDYFFFWSLLFHTTISVSIWL